MRTPIVLAGAIGGLLIAGGVAAQSLELNFGTTNDPGGMQYLSAEEWAKRVNAALGDQAEVTVFGSSQLGTDTEMLQKLKLGTLDFSQPSTVMSSVIPQFGLFDMPYLVKDRQHADCIAKEIIWPDLAPLVEEQGFKLIGVWENGFRQITNNTRPINTPEDLQGLKLRTPSGVWRVKMFQAYGANPTPMEFSELFVALQTGVVDGQENPYANVTSAKFDEVQKYLSETNHVYTPSFPVASVRRWQSWPPEVQEAILQAGQEVQGWTLETAERLGGEVRQQLIDGGMEFNEADREAFVAASKPVYDQFAAEVEGGQELIDRALALADGC
jgi:tripartite ATP-independent transporter DctP family solute receptor